LLLIILKISLFRVKRWFIMKKGENGDEDEINAKDDSKDGLDASNEAVYAYPATASIRTKELFRTTDARKPHIR
jgi:hypothetical protein